MVLKDSSFRPYLANSLSSCKVRATEFSGDSGGLRNSQQYLLEGLKGTP